MILFGAHSRHVPVAFSWKFAGLTDIGQARLNKEDAVAFDCPSGIALLAEGTGGHDGGEVVSGLAVATLQARLCGALIRRIGVAAPRRAALHRLLATSVNQANNAICKAGQLHSHRKGMDATLVPAAFDSMRVVVSHVGDITQAEADCSPDRHLVTALTKPEPVTNRLFPGTTG